MPAVLERSILSVDEASEAFRALNDDELCDIYAAAGRLVALSPFFDSPPDLVDEALVAVLDGHRLIPSDKSFVAVFIMIMKSLASHEVKRAKRSTGLEEAAELFSPLPSPERAAIAAEKVRRLQEAFAGDEEVSAILLAREEGLSLREISETLGIAIDRLEAGRKRLARWIERSGWKTEQ